MSCKRENTAWELHSLYVPSFRSRSYFFVFNLIFGQTIAMYEFSVSVDLPGALSTCLFLCVVFMYSHLFVVFCVKILICVNTVQCNIARKTTHVILNNTLFIVCMHTYIFRSIKHVGT